MMSRQKALAIAWARIIRWYSALSFLYWAQARLSTVRRLDLEQGMLDAEIATALTECETK
jgi:hypothetical protein